MTQSIHYLMCPPNFYDVDYVINPWMVGNVHRSSRERATKQWQALYTIISERTEVELVNPAQGWPDMVFTANAGLILGQTVVLSRFYHPERQGEQPYFKDWFEAKGYTVFELPQELAFEGAGDALLDRSGRWLWAGYGFRSMLESHPYLAKWLEIEVLSLRLVDERFYHLDTCFCPLSNGYLLYYPGAFDTYSNRLIEMRVPADKRIAIDEPDAVNFACNAVDINGAVVLNHVSEGLREQLTQKGFSVVETDLTEFLKAGGAAKCLTLRLTEQVAPEAESASTVFSRAVELQGHLMDSDILGVALDLIVENGGSFQILKFELGEKRQSTSSVHLQVSAPTEDRLQTILSELIERGAQLEEPVQTDARLSPVTKSGVAPQEFYVTTIYPTQVYVNGSWITVERQRMDAAIVVSFEDGFPRAQCVLPRDMTAGQEVVCGVDGIRTVRAPSRERAASQQHEFSFMGAGVSSERRVELVVEQIAWEMRQVKERGG